MEHTIKPCPFCGNEVYLQKVPLWSEGGHGYYGCYEYKIECEKCGCKIWCDHNNTIYNTDEIAKDNMIKAWNRRAENEQRKFTCRNKENLFKTVY